MFRHDLRKCAETIIRIIERPYLMNDADGSVISYLAVTIAIILVEFQCQIWLDHISAELQLIDLPAHLFSKPKPR